jgi:hypothetical protein
LLCFADGLTVWQTCSLSFQGFMLRVAAPHLN